MIDFPNTPVPGQVHNPGTGPIYTWDGVAWNLTPVQVKTARDKNILVNGAMTVGQENAFTAGSANGYWPADQWQMFAVGPICSTGLVQVVSPANSPCRLRKTVTTQKPALVTNDCSIFSQAIEGTRLVGLGFGTPAAVQLVLRFGFKGPAGTYSISVRNGVPNRTYIKNFTITAAQANIDTVQTFVIPGDVTGTWVTDGTAGMYIGIADALAANFLGVEGWQASGNVFGTVANTNQAAVNGNVVELFDVGLYADPDKTGVPPPFEVPFYADELITCQRYWRKYVQHTVYTGYGSAGNGFWGDHFFAPVMRANPTISGLNVTFANCGGLNAASYDYEHVRLLVTISVAGVAYFIYDLTVNARM